MVRQTRGQFRLLAKWAITLLLLFIVSLNGYAFPVQVAEAPSTTLALITEAIHRAKKTLQVNIYELSSPEIVTALIERIQAGVRVEVLEEGQPVGGFSALESTAQNRIVQAMIRSRGSHQFYEMTSKAGGKRRYRFNHAKYIIVDEKSLLIGSENYSPTGHPRPGMIGNRGWEVFMHDETLTTEFLDMFHRDSDLQYRDIIDRLQSPRQDLKSMNLYSLFGMLRLQTDEIQMQLRSSQAPVAPWVTLEADSAYKIISPESSLTGLLSLISQARRRLDLELMSMDLNWGKSGEESPLFDAVVSAARRGVQVRVLLNDESVFLNRGAKPAVSQKRPEPHLTDLTSKNRITVEALRQTAQKYKLKLSARIANVKRMGVDYIHNKGALVDDDQTLISSINWGENSVENNREAAVVIQGRAIQAHYQELLEMDWKASEVVDGVKVF